MREIHLTSYMLKSKVTGITIISHYAYRAQGIPGEEIGMVLDPAFDETYARLAAAWTNHHDLRANGASIAELVASRSSLDTLRLTAARMRRSATRPA